MKATRGRQELKDVTTGTASAALQAAAPSSYRKTGFRISSSTHVSPPRASTSASNTQPNSSMSDLPPLPDVPSQHIRLDPSTTLFPRAVPGTGHMIQDEDSKMVSKLLYFTHYLQNLKLCKRTGWYHHNVPFPESISDHMYRMAVLSILIESDEIDFRKCATMALVHDMAEALVGDLTPLCKVEKEEKRRREVQAIHFLTHDLLGDTQASRRIYDLWHEYEDRQTPEAKLVKDLDCFELCLQAYEYERTHNITDLQPFWDGAAPKQLRSAIQVEEMTGNEALGLWQTMESGSLKSFTLAQPPSPGRTDPVRKPTPILVGERRRLQQEEAKDALPKLSESAPTTVESPGHHLDRLRENEYLNDTLIEFGLRFLQEHIKTRDPALAQQTFEKRYIVIPIHENMHWYLAIVVNPQMILRKRPPVHSLSSGFQLRRSARRPSEGLEGDSNSPAPTMGAQDSVSESESTYVFVLDSLGTHHGPVKTALRDYLRLEARAKGFVPADIDLKSLEDPIHIDVRVPEQPNYCDCGIYLLHFFDRYFSDPDYFFRIILASRRGCKNSSEIHEAWQQNMIEKKRSWWRDQVLTLSSEWTQQHRDE
ncbi:hypothetical protein MEQU1_001269 [Malassezia equina]|uniref:5'-deoxynucleotidase n=1 Tax=Malassezia equina TaxID=1381935 RepID=A0AAF0IYS6_9BASI|nr:hypothetical protein MEQU1_001269 [Malassezia equina]